MPIINLTPTDRIISAPRTWEWQRLKIRKHRLTHVPIESWDFYRNYTSLESALTDVANVRIRTSKYEDIRQAIQEVKDAMASVSKAITQPLMNDVKAISKQFGKEGKRHGSKS
ncbi:hypothetical protein MCEKH45_01086 [Methylophilaceae bacterium]